MPRKFEAWLDPALIASFRVAFLQAMQQAGFEKVLELSPTPGLHLWEFRKKPHLVAMTVTSEGRDKERLHIESETLDVGPYVIKTVLLLADEFLTAFEKLTETLEDTELRERLMAWHREMRGLSQSL